jgi:hypothetical protein
MKNKEETMAMLLSVISEEYPKMSKSKKAELAKIVFDLIQLLNESKIEESANIILKNYELVRML